MYFILCILGCSGPMPPITAAMYTCSPVAQLRQGSGLVRYCDYVPRGARHAQWERDTDGVWRLYYR